jgi:hypothetical protein
MSNQGFSSKEQFIFGIFHCCFINFHII